jgi:hypothetical protein
MMNTVERGEPIVRNNKMCDVLLCDVVKEIGEPLYFGFLLLRKREVSVFLVHVAIAIDERVKKAREIIIYLSVSITRKVKNRIVKKGICNFILLYFISSRSHSHSHS